MTKEEYIKIRDGGEEFPLSLFYEYGIDNGMNVSENEFYEHFPKFMFGRVAVMTPQGARIFNYQSIITKIITHFNEKFEL